MKTTAQDPFARNITWQKCLVIFLVISSLVVLTDLSLIGDFLNLKLSKKLEFTLRESLHNDPKLNPRLKILSVDDSTVSFLRSPDLTLSQWSKLISALEKRKPAAIIIDAIFGLAGGTEQEISEFRDTVKAGGNVAVGCFSAEQKISHRSTMPLDKFGYNYLLANYLDQNSSSSLNLIQEMKWLPQPTKFIYGPDPLLVNAFRFVGQITYLNDGLVLPFLRIKTNDDFVVPHLGFFVADKIRLEKNGPWIDDQRVHLDRTNRLPVNFLSAKEIYENAGSLLPFLTAALQGFSLSTINQDDIVVILPRMFTGNTDVYETPIGDVPGGFIIVSLINSTLNKDWLRPINYDISAIFLSAIIGTLLGIFLWTKGIWICLFLLPLGFFLVSTALFSKWGLILPWTLPALSLILTNLFVFIERFRLADKRAQVIRDALRTSLSPDKFREILKNPANVQLEASEQIVTVMFVDIVGFSLTAERQTPKEIFNDLKDIISLIRQHVHEFEGVVDKTLGDGLLCFFGYNYQKKETPFVSSKNQAEQALECAIEIQRSNLVLCLKNETLGLPIYPLRIGINTATVYIGDMGDDRSLDFTLIGHGVNYAKRLESACDLFKIMIGPTTRDLLGNLKSDSNKLKPKHLKIKHHKDTLEAYEFDPFINDQESLNRGLQAYKHFSGYERKEPRWPVQESTTITIMVKNEIGRLLDFSFSGFSIELENYFASGVELELLINDQTNRLKASMQKEGLVPLITEVRWSKPVGKKYVHGFLIRNLSYEQKEKLCSLLREEIK